MNIRNIRFDNPDDPAQTSKLCVDICMRLMALDFARRSFERKDDETSRRRAKELREYFRKTLVDSVIALRSLVPEDILSEHSRLEVQRVMRDEEEERDRLRKERRLAKLEANTIRIKIENDKIFLPCIHCGSPASFNLADLGLRRI